MGIYCRVAIIARLANEVNNKLNDLNKFYLLKVFYKNVLKHNSSVLSALEKCEEYLTQFDYAKDAQVREREKIESKSNELKERFDSIKEQDDRNFKMQLRF